MPKEQEPPLPRLTALRFDYDRATIIIEADGTPVAQLPFPAAGVIFQADRQVTAGDRPGGSPQADPVLPDAATHGGSESHPNRKERNQVVRLTGELLSNPTQGKADRSGNPTAFARFTIPGESEGEPHHYLATFHRHTAKIALTLGKRAQVTVEGYVHPSRAEQRLDTLSVINLVQYPGKPQRRAR